MWSKLCRHPIHNLVQYHAPDDVILALLSAQKDAAKSLDSSDDVFPLHHAIEFNVPDVIILALLEAHPEAAETKGVDGDLPLVMAIKSNCSDEVILSVLAANRAAAWKGYNEKGELPINYALGISSNEVIVELLIEVVCSPFPEKWDVLNDVVKLKGEDIILEVAEGVQNNLVRHGILCNMIMVQNEVSDKAIVQFLSNFPETATIKDSEGNFPLHIAINMKRSVAVIIAVFRAYKGASKVRSSQGNLPLHLALKNGYEKSNKFLKELLSANYEAAGAKDEDGDLPLHLALEMKASESVVLEIFRASRKDATTFMSRSSRGYLPLHAAMHNVFSDKVLTAILHAFPEAATIKDPTGDLPLYACIGMKRSDTVIMAVLDANIGATKESSTKGELPLHGAIKNKYADEVILKIMKAYPCAAMIRCQMTGMLPLHLAAASTVSSNVIEALIRKYPEALDKLANGASPSDLVSSALPDESIEMLCKQVSYWKQDTDRESRSAEKMEEMSQQLTMMSEILLEVGNKLSFLSAKVDTTQDVAMRTTLQLGHRYHYGQSQGPVIPTTSNRGQLMPNVAHTEGSFMSTDTIAVEKDRRFMVADELILDGRKYRIVEANSNLGAFENISVPDDIVKATTKDNPNSPFIAAEEDPCVNATGAPIAQISTSEQGQMENSPFIAAVEDPCVNSTGAPITQISTSEQGQKEESMVMEPVKRLVIDETHSVAQGDLTSLEVEQEATETISTEMRKKSFETDRSEVLDYLKVEASESNEMRLAAICLSNDTVDDVDNTVGSVQPTEHKTSANYVDVVQNNGNSPLPKLEQNHCTNDDPSAFLSEILHQVTEEPLRIGCAEEDLSNEVVPTVAAKSQRVPAGKSKLTRKKSVSYKEIKNEEGDENDSFDRNTRPSRRRKSDRVLVEERSLTCPSDSFDAHSVAYSQSSDSMGTLLFFDEVSDVCLDKFFCFGDNSAPSLKRHVIVGK